MSYVDGFVCAVPTANRQKYHKHATEAAVAFKDHGALSFVECWGDDVPDGNLTSFPMAAKCQPDETVVFSWVIWPSRQTRDEDEEKDPEYARRPADEPHAVRRCSFDLRRFRNDRQRLRPPTKRKETP